MKPVTSSPQASAVHRSAILSNAWSQPPMLCVNHHRTTPTRPDASTSPVMSHAHQTAKVELRVIGVHSDLQLIIILGFGFRGWAPAQPMHEPVLVVPADPRAGDVLQVGQGVDRPPVCQREVRQQRYPIITTGRDRITDTRDYDDRIVE